MGLSVVTYALCKKYADSKLAQANGQKESKVVQELPTSNIDKNAIYYVIKKKKQKIGRNGKTNLVQI